LAFLNQSVQRIAAMMVLPGSEQEVFHHRRYKELEAELGNAPEINELFGEAPNAESVVPGTEAAGQFNQQRGQGPQGGGGQPQDRMVEKMIYSGGQSSEAQ
jgi:hypothetical protein